MKIICPRCKGKGEVIDWLPILGTAGILALYSLADRELTRETCGKCKGKGSIKI
jgi:RecJ-like exonuclease